MCEQTDVGDLEKRADSRDQAPLGKWKFLKFESVLCLVRIHVSCIYVVHQPKSSSAKTRILVSVTAKRILGVDKAVANNKRALHFK